MNIKNIKKVKSVEKFLGWGYLWDAYKIGGHNKILPGVARLKLKENMDKLEIGDIIEVKPRITIERILAGEITSVGDLGGIVSADAYDYVRKLSDEEIKELKTQGIYFDEE